MDEIQNSIDEVYRLAKEIKSLENSYGIGSAIIVVLAILVLIFTWRYLMRRAETMAESAAERSLKKFQAEIDKELVKFQTKHQKQVDAIHDTYQKFQRLTSMIDYLMNGEKFVSQGDPHQEVEHLVKRRHEFKKVFKENRLLFSKSLKEKIESVLKVIDEFIETYSNGIFPKSNYEPTPEEQKAEEENGGLYLAGIWRSDAFDDIMKNLKQISEDIETEFSKIYGTE